MALRYLATKVQEVMTDPSSSLWLREAAAGLLPRDPVDAANDAEWLYTVTKEWAKRTYEEGMRLIREPLVVPRKPAPRLSAEDIPPTRIIREPLDL
jgi:hypothetical protein